MLAQPLLSCKYVFVDCLCPVAPRGYRRVATGRPTPGMARAPARMPPSAVTFSVAALSPMDPTPPPAKPIAVSPLLEAVRACTACAAHLPLGPRPVLQWHPAARLLVAAQAPGRRVHATGVPFDDASGARLRDWLGLAPEVFYDPTQVAILPMGFCYPGAAAQGDRPPRPECARLWRARLLQGLPQLGLTLVMGRHALAWHLPDAPNLTDAVRDWQRFGPHCMPLPHPSPTNNRWLARNRWFEAEVVPLLRARVAALLGSARPLPGSPAT